MKADDNINATPQAGRASAIDFADKRRYENRMLYIKSVFAGMAAVVISVVLFPLVGIPAYKLIVRPGAEVVGWDPVAAAKSPTVWLAVLIIFAGGFTWEFRRLRKQA